MGCSSGSNVSLEVACSLGGANGMVDVVTPDEAYLRRRLYGTPRRPQQRQPAQRTTRHIFHGYDVNDPAEAKIISPQSDSMPKRLKSQLVQMRLARLPLFGANFASQKK